MKDTLKAKERVSYGSTGILKNKLDRNTIHTVTFIARCRGKRAESKKVFVI